MSAHPLERFNRFLFRFGRRLQVPDFDLRALLPDQEERERIAAKVAAALVVLRDHTPVRYACLRRDLPRIWVSSTLDLAQCFYGVGICLLRFDYVVSPKTTPEALALTFVHEGTHARLARAGFPYGEAERARIERLCVFTELLVARRLPGGEQLVADAEDRAKMSAEFWSNAASQERDVQRLQRLGGVGRLAAKVVILVLRFRRRGVPPNKRLKLAARVD